MTAAIIEYIPTIQRMEELPGLLPQLIENNAGQDGYEPQVAMSGQNAVAVWYQYDGSNYRIYSNYSTDGGATWLTAQLIENNAGQDGYEPQVAMSGQNVVGLSGINMTAAIIEYIPTIYLNRQQLCQP